MIYALSELLSKIWPTLALQLISPEKKLPEVQDDWLILPGLNHTDLKLQRNQVLCFNLLKTIGEKLYPLWSKIILKCITEIITVLDFSGFVSRTNLWKHLAPKWFIFALLQRLYFIFDQVLKYSFVNKIYNPVYKFCDIFVMGVFAPGTAVYRKLNTNKILGVNSYQRLTEVSVLIIFFKPQAPPT